jgi:hypothetical protein
MKLISLLSLILALSFANYGQSFTTGREVNSADSIVMGPGYADDIYYSFEDGIVATVSRTNWDIGFRTSLWTATIITNGAAGVNLYTYPKSDTSGWNTVDTSGMAGWIVLYDDENDWETGAFNINQSGHPDYGWGKYNPITHDVVGDSLYILKTIDGSFKKIWIQRKNSSANTYYIRHAGLDGSNDHVAELNINPYTDKNFVYYDFATEAFIDRDTDTATWDLLFTKYMAIQENGTPYPVVGVLNNIGVPASAFYKITPDFIDYMSLPFDSTKSPVGWEWKTFDMGTFTWTVDDSAAFFVRSQEDNVYKLVFKKFEGSSTGKIIFEKELMSSAGIIDRESAGEALVYPNPVKEHLTVDFGNEITGTADVAIFDISGRQVYSSRVELHDHLLSLQMAEINTANGLHLVKVMTADGLYSSKFMVYRD